MPLINMSNVRGVFDKKREAKFRGHREGSCSVRKILIYSFSVTVRQWHENGIKSEVFVVILSESFFE